MALWTQATIAVRIMISGSGQQVSGEPQAGIVDSDIDLECGRVWKDPLSDTHAAVDAPRKQTVVHLVRRERVDPSSASSVSSRPDSC